MYSLGRTVSSYVHQFAGGCFFVAGLLMVLEAHGRSASRRTPLSLRTCYLASSACCCFASQTPGIVCLVRFVVWALALLVVSMDMTDSLICLLTLACICSGFVSAVMVFAAALVLVVFFLPLLLSRFCLDINELFKSATEHHDV